MATNVVVACRFRPPSKNEKAEGASIVCSVDGSGTGVAISDPSQPAGSTPAKFNFDRVFDFVASQAEVYEHTAKPLVKEVFAGYNCTVFAYGQTGSGKTHTMVGYRSSETDKGIIPRLIDDIFHGIEEAEEGIEFTVKISYVEIYNERVRDLLTSRGAASDNLKIRELPTGGVYIENVTETYVNSIDAVMQLMNDGQSNRAIAATNMNEQSSRSHSVFILTLGQVDERGSKRGAKLFLVDLAGSEKVAKTGAAGSVLLEAQNINKSLLLRQVSQRGYAHVKRTMASLLSHPLFDTISRHTPVLFSSHRAPISLPLSGLRIYGTCRGFIYWFCVQFRSPSNFDGGASFLNQIENQGPVHAPNGCMKFRLKLISFAKFVPQELELKP